MLPPPLLPQEIRRYDPLGARLQPLGPENMAASLSNRLHDSLLFRPRSTRSLHLFHRKRCAPNREERLRWVAKLQNFDGLTVQLIPMPSVPLQLDRLPSLAERHPAPARASKLVRQSASLPSACQSTGNSATDLS